MGLLMQAEVFIELNKTLLTLGCKVSRYDPAMYLYFASSGELSGMFFTHVDDFLHGSGNADFQTSF